MATAHSTGAPGGGELSAALPRPTLRQRVGAFGASDRSQLGIVAFSHGVQHSYGAALGIAYPFILAQFHESYAVLGLLLGVLGIVGGVLQGAAALVRKLSARVLLAGQNFAIAVAMALAAVAPGFGAFAAARALGTLSSWPQHPVGSAHLVERFPDRRGFVLSIHTAGGSIGSACVPLVASALIASWGWRWSLVFFACMMALGGLLVTSRLKVTAPRVASPAAAPAGEVLAEAATAEASMVDPATAEATVAPVAGRPAEGRAQAGATADAPPGAEPSGAEPSVSLRKAITSRAAIAIVVAGTLSAAGRGQGVLTTFVPGYLKDGLHLPTITVGLIVALMVTGGIVGPVVAGHASDRFDRRRVLLVAYLIGAVVLAGFVRVGSGVGVLIAVGVVMGVFSYSEQPLRQALFSDATRGANARGAFGLYWALSAAGAFWLSVLGAITTTFGFQAAFYTMGASFVAAAVVIAVLGESGGTARAGRTGRRAAGPVGGPAS